MQSIAFTDLRDHAARQIRALPIGVTVDLTYRGEVIGTVTRCVMRGDYPEGIGEVSTGELQRGTFERAELLRAGGAFAITAHGRRIAVVKGVQP